MNDHVYVCQGGVLGPIESFQNNVRQLHHRHGAEKPAARRWKGTSILQRQAQKGSPQQETFLARAVHMVQCNASATTPAHQKHQQAEADFEGGQICFKLPA